MKILRPRENALFMLSWRERARASHVAPHVAVFAVVVALAFVGVLRSQGSDGDLTWVQYWLGLYQWFVLVAFGGHAVGKVMSRELRTDTLAFHRASPTPPFDQVLGIVFGAPWLEWCMWGAATILMLLIGLFSSAPTVLAIETSLSVALTGLMLHSVIAALSLVGGDARSSRMRTSVPFMLIILLLLSVPLSEEVNMRIAYHLHGMSGLFRLYHEVVPYHAYRSPPPMDVLYGWRVPVLLYQLLVVAPLIVTAWYGATRKIASPYRTALPRIVPAMLTMWALALQLGVMFPVSRSWWGAGGDTRFLLLALALGIFGAATTTPTRIAFVRECRRGAKLGTKVFGLSSEIGSSWEWPAGFAVVSAMAFLVPGFRYIESEALTTAGCWAAVSLQVAWFSFALEYFLLGPYRKKLALFALLTGVPWLFLPLFGAVSGLDLAASLLSVASPLYSPFHLADSLSYGSQANLLCIAVLANLALAVVFGFATMRLRARVSSAGSEGIEIANGG